MRSFKSIGILLGAMLAATAASAAETSVSDLIKALGSREEPVRLEAIDRLGQFGERAAEAVPALTRLLKDESAAVRAHAAESLGEIGAPAKSAVPALATLVTDPSEAVRRKAIEAVGKIRPGPEVCIPLFLKVIEDAEPAVRIRALHALAEAGEPAVPFLIEALKNERAAYWACLVLSDIGPDAKAAVPALIEAFKLKELGVRREAILALAEIGPASAPAIPALAELLDDEIDRVPATYALGRIGRVPEKVEDRIERNAKSSDPVLSTVSFWALAKFHPDNKQLVRKATEMLAEGLKQEDPAIRKAAARALVDLDPDPEIALPVLKKALQDVDPQTLDSVLATLAGLGERILPRVIEALKVEEARPKAAAIIARIGPAAKAAVPALIDALSDENPETRSEVLFALAAIGPDAQAAVPAITKALNDPETSVCYAACYALGKIGQSAMPAKPQLQKNLAAEDEFLAMASAWALARIHPECKETAPRSVPLLIRALAEPEVTTRAEAAESLCCLGPLAKDAVPALRKALRDNDEAVREAAAKALKAIGQ